ncbi:MAG: hypothetical protein U1D69_00595 [Polynucleobacter sp.]|nr:hypothetical protein [Polynucleobacter sp.]
MMKAYIGFSSPVGYDYVNEADKCESDLNSSPNPVLVGATGIFTLFDEIWFPCRSICPQSMRGLSYVRFLAEEFPTIQLDLDHVNRISEAVPSDVSLNAIHPDGFNAFMSKYYGISNGVDNHTHGVSAFGQRISGNPSHRNLVLDLHILDQLDNEFTPVLNGLTGRMAFPEGLNWLLNPAENNAIQLADRALSIHSLYDIVGPKGPYHPVVEELREHEFIKSFRNWARGEASALHNRSPEDILLELSTITRDFEESAMLSAIGKNGLRDTTVTYIKDLTLGMAPGAAAIKTTMDLVAQKRWAEQRKLSTFVAQSRGAIWRAKARALPRPTELGMWFSH